MQTLNFLKSRRIWVVKDFLVWGTSDQAQLRYLGLETINSTGRLMFGTASLGGSQQNVIFSELVDFRGNHLPSSIDFPKVLIRLRSSYAVYLAGEESDYGFRIARETDAPGPVMADLFIIEMGY
jgi:hypothetical protein